MTFGRVVTSKPIAGGIKAPPGELLKLQHGVIDRQRGTFVEQHHGQDQRFLEYNLRCGASILHAANAWRDLEEEEAQFLHKTLCFRCNFAAFIS